MAASSAKAHGQSSTLMKASQPQSRVASDSFNRQALASASMSFWHADSAEIKQSTNGGRASSEAQAGATNEAASYRRAKHNLKTCATAAHASSGTN
jgi:hypothetical protein